MGFEFNPTMYIGAGAIIAAVITGFWSFISLIISKDQKVSEFRQSWIDSVRDEISDFASKSHAVHSKWIFYCKANKEKIESSADFMLEHSTDFEKIFSLANRIKLRLNPEENEDILTAIDDLECYISGSQGMNDDSLITNTSNKLIDLTQVMLKKEWGRVKSGEKSFRYSRNLAFVMIVILLIYGGSYFA